MYAILKQYFAKAKPEVQPFTRPAPSIYPLRTLKPRWFASPSSPRNWGVLIARRGSRVGEEEEGEAGVACSEYSGSGGGACLFITRRLAEGALSQGRRGD